MMMRMFGVILVVVLLCLFAPCGCLALSANPNNAASSISAPTPAGATATGQRPIERVAVIGAGIAGLSVAHALTNSPRLCAEYDTQQKQRPPFVVDIYDSRPELDLQAGAGIQLNGGLAVLGQINPAVQRAVMDAGLPQARVQSRCKSWSSSGRQEFDTLLQLDLKETVRSGGEEVRGKLIQDDQLLWTTIMRGALQEALLKTLPESTADRLHFGKTLVDIQPAAATTHEDGGGVTCRFSDGSTAGPYDIVIGCDGIKSAVKEYVETGSISADPAKREGASAALYSGVRIRYAVQDGAPRGRSASEGPAAPPSTLSQYFGNGAYGLHGVYGAGDGVPNAESAFLVYLDKDYIGPFRRKSKDEEAGGSSSGSPTVGENADWSQDVRKSVDIARENMLQQLRDCGIQAADPMRSVIANADRFFELGVYFHNPFSLGGWTKPILGTGGCCAVLCGDAAHAMPPFLGQGSNQAVQDAFCLATKLYEYNAAVLLARSRPAGGDDSGKEEEEVRLTKLLREYEQTRWPTTFNIFWKAAILGYLETGGFDGFYAKFRDVFFKTMGFVGVAERVLLSAAVPKV